MYLVLKINDEKDIKSSIRSLNSLLNDKCKIEDFESTIALFLSNKPEVKHKEVTKDNITKDELDKILKEVNATLISSDCIGHKIIDAIFDDAVNIGE